MSDINSLVPQSVRSLVDGQIRQLLAGAKIEKIVDNIQRENLNELLKCLARHRIDLGKEHEAAKQPHLKAYKAICKDLDDYFEPIIIGLKNMESENGQLCLEYDKAERKKIEDARREEEERAAKERARLEAIEVRKREEAARLAAEAEEIKAKAAAAEGAERARLEAEQAEKERKANLAFESANRNEEKAAAVVATPVLNTYRAPSGIKPKKTYTVEITDPATFIKACVAAGKFHWLSVEEGKVNKEITANEGKWQFPGARVKEETGTRINTRRAA